MLSFHSAFPSAIQNLASALQLTSCTVLRRQCQLGLKYVPAHIVQGWIYSKLDSDTVTRHALIFVYITLGSDVFMHVYQHVLSADEETDITHNALHAKYHLNSVVQLSIFNIEDKTAVAIITFHSCKSLSYSASNSAF